MEYIIKEKNIWLVISATNSGKFRFKKRKDRLDFGEIFSTRECLFDEQTYLEWQIGYDVPVKDVGGEEKNTKLNKKSFIGNNGKIKYPYELSEIFWTAIELNLISKEEVKCLLDEIRKYTQFIDEKVISVVHHSKLSINGVHFEETSKVAYTFYG